MVDDSCQPPTEACTPTAANGFCSNVLGEKQTRQPAVRADKVVRLPFTGVPVSGLVLWAVVTIGGGGALVAAGRRRRRC
jgi:hypothetical protein